MHRIERKKNVLYIAVCDAVDTDYAAVSIVDVMGLSFAGYGWRHVVLCKPAGWTSDEVKNMTKGLRRK